MMRKLGEYYRLCRQRAADGHQSVPRQVFEMGLLWLWSGNGPGFYHMAGLWHKDISFREKLQHLGQSGYIARLKHLNPEDYRKISQHKISEKGFLTLLGFPTPRFLGFYHPVYGRDCGGNELLDGHSLVTLLRRQKVLKACLKQIEGWGGQGFEIIEVVAPEGNTSFRLLSSGKIVDPAAVFDDCYSGKGEFGGILVEEYLDQHETLLNINPSSVNTLRIWVLQKQLDSAATILAYLRIGREGAIVDNRSRGGLIAPINLETGEIGCAIDAMPQRELFERHPDHGARIEGAVVPFWKEAKGMAEDCLNCFPKMRFAGMDIAIARNGPFVVEMNVCPDKEGGSRLRLPTGTVLRVD